MVQQVGETTDALKEADEKIVQDILNANPTGRYWIVIAYKPAKQRLRTGEVVIRRAIKTSKVRPKNLLGTVILEVKDGEIVEHDINLHDVPIDWKQVGSCGLITTPYVQTRPDIASAYVYND
jgi:hypothetical protein